MRIIFLSFLLLAGLSAQAECEGPHAGKKIDQEALENIIRKHDFEKAKLNFCKADLSGVDLSQRDLSAFIFTEADLSGANLSYSDLTRVDLNSANVTKAKFVASFFRWGSMRNINAKETDFHDARIGEVDLEGANFTSANLSGVRLIQSRASNSIFTMANLSDAQLAYSDLRMTDFRSARLDKVDFGFSVATGARLNDAVAIHTDFTNADFSNADFSKTNLMGARFSHTRLANANFYEATVRGALFRPEVGSIPNVVQLATVEGFSQMQFVEKIGDSAPVLTQLRYAYKQVGIRDMERQVTSLYKKIEQEEMIAYGLTEQIGVYFKKIFFEYTTDFGNDPLRPLFLLLITILLFSIPYRIHFTNPSPKIYVAKGENRVQVRALIPGHLQRVSGWILTWYAFYYSVLNTFSFGTKELSIAGILTRCQHENYNWQSHGGMRTLGGIQTILGLYFVTLWALCTFGRPFEW